MFSNKLHTSIVDYYITTYLASIFALPASPDPAYFIMPPPPWLSSARSDDLVHILPFSGGCSFSPLCTESDILCGAKRTDPPDPVSVFTLDPSDPVFFSTGYHWPLCS
jgi:hypothetical protein